VTAHSLNLLMNVKSVFVKEPFNVEARPEPAALVIQSAYAPTRARALAIYKNHLPSMDEGWTRWCSINTVRLLIVARRRSPRGQSERQIRRDHHSRSIRQRAGQRFTRRSGSRRDSRRRRERSLSCGIRRRIGEAGVKALREFIEAGGTVITFNNASNFAIEKLGAPARNVLKGVQARDFYCPGSILRARLDSSSPLAFGMEKESIAWFEGGPAFEITDPASASAIASYPESENPLLSGWILGDKLIRGRAAMVEAKIGKGRVILFGFRPQYRAQSLATVPLLFNAILTSKSEQ